MKHFCCPLSHHNFSWPYVVVLVMFLDASERAVTMKHEPLDSFPLTVLAKESDAFPCITQEQYLQLKFDSSGITKESRLLLLNLSFELYVRRWEILIRSGKVDTHDASSISFFHSSLLLGSRPPTWYSYECLH